MTDHFKVAILALLTLASSGAWGNELQARFSEREAKLYEQQRDRFIKGAKTKGYNWYQGASYHYHRPTLIDDRSFLIVKNLLGSEVLWLSTTDQYQHKKVMKDKLNFKGAAPHLFRTEYFDLSLTKPSNTDLADIAQTTLTQVKTELIGFRKLDAMPTQQSEVKTKTWSNPRSRPGPENPSWVVTAYQFMELRSGEICRLSNWVSSTDKYVTLLCINDKGQLDRPVLSGVLSFSVR